MRLRHLFTISLLTFTAACSRNDPKRSTEGAPETPSAPAARNAEGEKGILRIEPEMLRDLKDDFVTFEFDTRSSGESIVFPRAEMVSATENILNDNGVRSQGSTDVMKIWTAKTTDH